MKPERWRKKPVVIEAMPFDSGNAGDVIAWVNTFVDEDQDPAMWEVDGPCLMIMTLEGDMRADVGDWIIRGVKGEFYSCKPDVFEATYEAVDAHEAMLTAEHRALLAAVLADSPRVDDDGDV